MMIESILSHKRMMETVNETGLMKCNYCGTPIDVSDCDSYPEMVDKIVATHVQSEHPDKCVSQEEVDALLEEERRVDKDEYR